ncbi:MAG: GcrA cell cycle regulator [Rhodobacteraceae bacterium]|nr:MAG: GcrA cell cycle regulator [Paracoccaceae bacterium]
MSWTDERVEKLQAMWNEGLSAAQIAKALGGVTRNAVIGKVHRLGLSNRGPNAPKSAAEAETPPEAVAPTPTQAPAPEPEPEPAPEPKPVAAQPPAPPRPQSPLQRREPAPMTEDRLEVLANLAEIEKTARRVSLLDLTERLCKWPIGDPTDPDFHFCGLPAVPGKPYCAAHVAVAFQPMSSRRDRERSRVRH